MTNDPSLETLRQIKRNGWSQSGLLFIASLSLLTACRTTDPGPDALTPPGGNTANLANLFAE